MSKEKKTSTKKKASTKSTAKKEKAEPKKTRKSSVDKEEATSLEREELETPEPPQKLETTAITEEAEREPPAEAAGEQEAATEQAPAEEEEEIEIVEEKFYDLNLRRIWNTPREKRTPRAIRFLRDFVAHRMKTDEVSISEETNEMLWQRGISKPPRRIRVRVVKDKEGKVIVFPGEGK